MVVGVLGTWSLVVGVKSSSCIIVVVARRCQVVVIESLSLLSLSRRFVSRSSLSSRRCCRSSLSSRRHRVVVVVESTSQSLLSRRCRSSLSSLRQSSLSVLVVAMVEGKNGNGGREAPGGRANVDVGDQGAGPSVSRTLEYPVNDADRLEARVADMERDAAETERVPSDDTLDMAVEAPLAPSAATPSRLEVPQVADFSDVGLTRASVIAATHPCVLDVSLPPLFMGTEDRSVTLPRGLKFAWRPARRGILPAEFLSVARPRLDAYRFRLSAAADPDGGAFRYSMFMSAGPVFLVPEGLPCDVSFVRNATEVGYLDATAFALFLTPLDRPLVSPIAALKSLHVVPSAMSVIETRWSKQADGARRVFRLGFSGRD